MSRNRKKIYFWNQKYDWDQPSLSDRKLAAWAFAVGERPRRAEQITQRRPHRGQLPDVDFDRAIVDPHYRPLWLRITDLLLGGLRRRKQPAEAELRAALTAAVGERLAAAYIGEEQTGDAVSREADGKTDPTHWSRAA